MILAAPASVCASALLLELAHAVHQHQGRWADPVAAMCMPLFLIQKGRQAWCGEDSCPP